MRITERHLRQIIREELGRARSSRLVEASAGALERRYPRIFDTARAQPRGNYGHIDDVVSSKNPTLELEKLALYDTITRSGPDVSWKRLGPMLRRARKQVGDILQAYEDGTLEDSLEAAGMLGRSTDSLRDPADRFY